MRLTDMMYPKKSLKLHFFIELTNFVSIDFCAEEISSLFKKKLKVKQYFLALGLWRRLYVYLLLSLLQFLHDTY